MSLIVLLAAGTAYLIAAESINSFKIQLLLDLLSQDIGTTKGP